MWRALQRERSSFPGDANVKLKNNPPPITSTTEPIEGGYSARGTVAPSSLLQRKFFTSEQDARVDDGLSRKAYRSHEVGGRDVDGLILHVLWSTLRLCVPRNVEGEYRRALRAVVLTVAIL